MGNLSWQLQKDVNFELLMASRIPALGLVENPRYTAGSHLNLCVTCQEDACMLSGLFKVRSSPSFSLL